MKTKSYCRSMVAVLLLIMASSFSTEAPAKRFTPEGTWAYSVPGVPEGYDQGKMIIVKEEKGYGVTMAINEYAKAEAEDVIYKKKAIRFTVWVESEEVKVSGTFDGDRLSGTVALSLGEFELTATRIK